jgi:hypothetical protein
MACMNCDAYFSNQDVTVTSLTVYEREHNRLRLDLYCEECNEWYDCVYIYPEGE